METLVDGAKILGFELSPRQLEQFNIYYRELVDWNRRMNLTAITGREDVQVNHFLDSLTVTIAWQQPSADTSLRLIDVGTGAGVPGIPLKILFPDIKLTLLEATAKKTDFLRHITQELELDNVEIVTGRAEEIAKQEQYRENFDVVLSRAVASLPTLVELTLPFCAIGGSLIAMKKGNIEIEIDKAAKAISLLGGNLREIKNIDLFVFDDKRRLIIIDKVSTTPEKYPRRVGMPGKRPI